MRFWAHQIEVQKVDCINLWSCVEDVLRQGKKAKALFGKNNQPDYFPDYFLDYFYQTLCSDYINQE
jgi:hypothetical protein